MSHTENKLAFQVEIKRVLEILSNDIYDSPYALLRENIQNAYDAILMRIQAQGNSSFSPKINVILDSKKVIISDNGIGMTEEVITNNFWKAGSSGKNNELAQKAGVVGTFGIGAMANFGVCSSLKVITHSIESDITIETTATRATLSLTEKCIEITVKDEKKEPGTEVIAELDEKQNLNEAGAIGYLNPYVQYVQIPIYINGKLISQKGYGDFVDITKDSLFDSVDEFVNHNGYSFNMKVNITKNSFVKIQCNNIKKGNILFKGEIALSQGQGAVYGLRNYFGLAPIPLSSHFGFGGIVNLSVLHPTAGREALSRESIELVNQITAAIEWKVAEVISRYELADSNSAFQNYIVAYNRFDLANNIKVQVKPNDENVSFKEMDVKLQGKKIYFFGGTDQQTILSFGNENSYLLLLSQNSPRRRIQHHLILAKHIEEVPNSPAIRKVYGRSDLSMAEVSLVLRITSIINDDYLISDVKVSIADISHQVPSMVQFNAGTVEIYLSRESGAVRQVLQAYDTAWEVFTGFVKDLIRNHLYQKFSNYVPSSTKQGADALQKILMRNRELYQYEYSDLGALESLMNDYVSGEIDFPEVLKKSQTIISTHSQYVQQNQIGSIEQELPSIVENNETVNPNIDLSGPLPPIIRTDNIDKKILKTEKQYPHLNNFTLFLGLSDRIFKGQYEFFLEPHTTRVIWGMHKIVYIFTHASNNLSLYYEIELKEKLSDGITGGRSIPTTTLITNNRIFIPIAQELSPYFDIKEGSKEFYVRYDVIMDLKNEK